MVIDHTDVIIHVLDRIVMRPTYCAYKESIEVNIGCQNDQVLSTQACQQHKKKWNQYIQN